MFNSKQFFSFLARKKNRGPFLIRLSYMRQQHYRTDIVVENIFKWKKIDSRDKNYRSRTVLCGMGAAVFRDYYNWLENKRIYARGISRIKKCRMTWNPVSGLNDKPLRFVLYLYFRFILLQFSEMYFILFRN